MNLRKSVVAGVATLCLAGLPAFAIAADLPPLSHGLTQLTPLPAPALKLRDLEGNVHDLAALNGKVVLVNFWATWCPPCRREMPSLERLSQALAGEAFVVLAVDVGEDAETIDSFTSQLDTVPTFPVLLDARSTAMQGWKVAGLPTTFLVDKQGRIVASAIGGREFDHPQMIEAIRGLLRKK
jgi:thiol-disulfide isomerase/thioredoxin